ncbi:MAG: undecaprenyldiphospho-muramoylpentapeptide beta-N-acetylglucosaminyltransferase [Anaerolineales bacterium]|nr:undecaprenyldiphospho-muramoylpentapeptide beta-N-acetylglucosaminyltransferase [Anaerolineales bacterium]
MISAGGTGGGVYPALAVAKAWMLEAGGGKSAVPPPILWLGTRAGMEAELIPRAGLPFQAIAAAGVHGVGWRRLPGNLWALLRGVRDSLAVIRDFRPDVVLVTGGFLAVPAAAAAWLRRVPVVIYLPDLEPGLALQAVGWLAARITVTAEAARRYFDPRRVVVTGYPVRPELVQVDRAAALQALGLAPGRKTILVTGGSRGARSLNRATLAALPAWLKDYQVVHLTGQLDWPEVEQAAAGLPADLRARYRAFPFRHEMGDALAAADLVVSRAGASALGEYPLFGLPAVLVPYPYAWRYQKVNADYLAARGAAVRLDDEALAGQLAATVAGLLADDERLARMRSAARSAAAPAAAQRIARELRAVAEGA